MKYKHKPKHLNLIKTKLPALVYLSLTTLWPSQEMDQIYSNKKTQLPESTQVEEKWKCR